MGGPDMYSPGGMHVLPAPDTGEFLQAESVGPCLCPSSPHVHKGWGGLTASPVPSLLKIRSRAEPEGKRMGSGIQIETTHLKELQLQYGK